MQDLTKINVPFGLLDKETQERLQAHGGPYEFYMEADEWEGFNNVPPSWHDNYVYRVKPQPEPQAPEKPEVKVGSWWKDLETGNIVEVLCVYEATVFVRIEGESKGYAWPLVDFNTGEIAPYTPPRKCEGWVNVYADGEGSLYFGERIYENEDLASLARCGDAITTVKIEYVEGQDND